MQDLNEVYYEDFHMKTKSITMENKEVIEDSFDIYENVEETDEELNSRISAEKNKKQQ